MNTFQGNFYLFFVRPDVTLGAVNTCLPFGGRLS